MAYSRIGWARGVFAPWCLGMALTLSMTADAGQEASAGASISPLSFRAPPPPTPLIPPHIAAVGGDFGRLAGEAQKLLRKASLNVGEADEFKRLADEIEPRADLKRIARPFPAIDRSGKSDPIVGIRPTFDTRLRHSGGLASLQKNDLVFSHDEGSPIGGFALLDGEIAEFDANAGFEPWPDGESPTTIRTVAETSPHRHDGSTMTMRPAAINERLMQGATASVHRAVALASATPAPADSTPIEVAALPVIPRSNISRVSPRATRPDHATLAEADHSAREQRCLAEAIYFEARGEAPEGQAAVAQVVLNRVASGLYPPTICGVVYQNRHRYNACQFSFACDGKSPRVTESEPWRQAVRIATEVTTGKTYVSDVGASTHYHADYVRPRWARSLEKMDVIGHHIFYKLRPGRS